MIKINKLKNKINIKLNNNNKALDYKESIKYNKTIFYGDGRRL